MWKSRAQSVALWLARVAKISLPLILLVTWAMVWLSAADAQESLPEEELVLIRRDVAARYDMPKIALSTGKQIVEGSLLRIVNVEPGDTISGIVSREFGVGRSNAHELYEVLEGRVLELNKLERPENLEVGPIILPDIPRMALTKPGPNPLNRMPRISQLCSLSEVKTGKGFDETGKGFICPPVVTAYGRPAAQSEAQYRWVTRSMADKLLQEGNTYVESALVDVVFTQEIQEGSAPVLLPEESKLIQEALANTSNARRLVLFIFDDGWPNQKAFRESRDFMVEAIRSVRTRFKLGQSSLPKLFLSQSNTTYPSPPEENSMHSDIIRRVLGELQLLDPEKRVRVIYVPLFRAQRGSKALLRELVEIKLLVSYLRSNLGDAVPDLKPHREHAKAIVSRISDSLEEGPMRSDKALIEGVLTLADLYSQVTKEPFFINMSWTVPELHYEVYFKPGMYGLVVAAAGNEQGTNIHDAGRMFAARSDGHVDTIAVIDVDEQGDPVCESNIIHQSNLVYGVAFSGRVDSTNCGTSFAAPRVAWLLAAHESIKPRLYSMQMSHWCSELQKYLVDLRDVSANGLAQLRLKPGHLFAQP